MLSAMPMVPAAILNCMPPARSAAPQLKGVNWMPSTSATTTAVTSTTRTVETFSTMP